MVFELFLSVDTWSHFCSVDVWFFGFSCPLWVLAKCGGWGPWSMGVTKERWFRATKRGWKGLCERTRGTLGLHEEAAFPQMKEGLEEGILWADCSRTNSKSGETLMEEKKIIKVTYPCPIILWPLKVSGREWSCGSGGIPKEWKWDRRKCWKRKWEKTRGPGSAPRFWVTENISINCFHVLPAVVI